MARVDNNAITEGTTGTLGKQIVYKRSMQCFLSKYSDRTHAKYNQKHKGNQKIFAQAVEYAKSVMLDPRRVAAYRKQIHSNKNIRGTSVYHAAIKAFLSKHSQGKSASKVAEILKTYQNTYILTERQEKAIKHLISRKKITNGSYQGLNKVSKATAARDLMALQKQGIIAVQSRGAGTFYSLVPLDDEGEMDAIEDEISLI